MPPGPPMGVCAHSEFWAWVTSVGYQRDSRGTVLGGSGNLGKWVGSEDHWGYSLAYERRGVISVLTCNP